MNRMSSRPESPRQRTYSLARNGSVRSPACARSAKPSTCNSAGEAATMVGTNAAAAMLARLASAPISSVGASGPGRWRTSWSTTSNPNGSPPGHAEFLLVDLAEQLTLVELGGPLQVAAQLAPRQVQQAHAHRRIGVDALQQPRHATPCALQPAETRMMQDRIHLRRHQRVNRRDHAVDRRHRQSGIARGT